MKKIMLAVCFVFLCVLSVHASPIGNGPVVFGTDGGNSLQGVLDTVFYDSNPIDVIDNQSDVRVWNNNDGSSTAFEIVYLAGNKNSIGIYDYSTNASASLGINSGTSAAFTTFSFADNSLLINGFAQAGVWSGNFGFFLDSTDNAGKTNTFYTEDSKNSGSTQAVAYNVPGGLNYDLSSGSLFEGKTSGVSDDGDDWIIAFEDILYSDSDKDFNDAVFYVKDMAPVPEPATLLLLGSGLAGLALYRRKSSKK